MDLVAIAGMVYVIGLVIMPILIRIIPKLDMYLYENINTPNPAVFGTVLWPAVIIGLSIYHIYKLFVATINWVSGNGFITKSNENYEY